MNLATKDHCIAQYLVSTEVNEETLELLELLHSELVVGPVQLGAISKSSRLGT